MVYLLLRYSISEARFYFNYFDQLLVTYQRAFLLMRQTPTIDFFARIPAQSLPRSKLLSLKICIHVHTNRTCTKYSHDTILAGIPEILSQNFIYLHWLCAPGNSKTMHCGILFNMSYTKQPLYNKTCCLRMWNTIKNHQSTVLPTITCIVEQKPPSGNSTKQSWKWRLYIFPSVLKDRSLSRFWEMKQKLSGKSCGRT